MSDAPQIFVGGLPTGRQLPGAPERPLGRFGTLPAASDELLAVLRRHVREIPQDDLERMPGGRYWKDLASGEELEIARGHVDPVAPQAAGCVAFSVRGVGSDAHIVPLMPKGHQGEATSTYLGEMRSGVATGRERL